MELSKEVLDSLVSYDWRGNVRELENTIEYMVAVCEDDRVELKHLTQNFFQYDVCEEHSTEENIDEFLAAKGNLDEFFFIMYKIYEFNKLGKAIGRKLISKLSNSFNYPLTEEKIRFRVDTLADLGLLGKCKGRSGMHLTLKGIDYIKNNSINKRL